jgi:hypothetical protein
VSEYQYYEFQAVDRPLTEDELAQVRGLSSRARISATHFVNEYHWGDFRGDVRKLMEQLYDAHLYWAAWGSRRLVLRLPAALLPARVVRPFADPDVLECWTKNGHALLDLRTPYEDDDGEWDWEQSFTLSSFLGLRAELAAGDLRPLYLAWLVGLRHWELSEEDEEGFASATEPPLPPGLGQLTGPQRALADFLKVDQDLLAAAADGSPALPQAEAGPQVDRAALAAWIAALPAKDKDRLLLDAVTGKAPQPGTALLTRYRAGRRTDVPEPARRTAAQLLDAAQAVRTGRRRAERQAREAAAQARLDAAARAREQHLARLATDPEIAWGDVDRLIAQKQQAPYDAAVALLRDLRELHDRALDRAGFDTRASVLRAAHRGKSSLMRRFDDAGFPNP